MRSRTAVSLGLLAVAGFAVAAFVLSVGRRPAGNTYHGLTASEWEREFARWNVSQPPCGNGGPGLFIWSEPSALASVSIALGISYPWEHYSPLPLAEGDPASLPVLLELFKSPDPKARRIAIEGVRRIGDPAKVAAPLLIEALDDPDYDVSREAAYALRKWDAARANRCLAEER